MLLLAVVFLLAGCGETAPAPPSPDELDRVWRPEGDTVEVKVFELDCEGCERAVSKALGALDGVAGVEADHETDLVRIRLADPEGRHALIPHLREALHRVGRKVVGEDEIPSE